MATYSPRRRSDRVTSRYAPFRNLMIWNAAIYCALVVQDTAVVGVRWTLVYKPRRNAFVFEPCLSGKRFACRLASSHRPLIRRQTSAATTATADRAIDVAIWPAPASSKLIEPKRSATTRTSSIRQLCATRDRRIPAWVCAGSAGGPAAWQREARVSSTRPQAPRPERRHALHCGGASA